MPVNGSNNLSLVLQSSQGGSTNNSLTLTEPKKPPTVGESEV